MSDGVWSDKEPKASGPRKGRAGPVAVEAPVSSERDLGKRIKALERQMLEHARNLEFEQAARVRDQLSQLKEQAFGATGREALPDTDAA